MRTIHRLFLALLFITFIPILASANALLDETRALNLLAARVQKDGLYNGRVSINCMSIILEEASNSYFDFAVHEKHGGKCPGDPNTAPILDRFRVNRETQDIQWYEPVDGEFLPYTQALKGRSR